MKTSTSTSGIGSTSSNSITKPDENLTKYLNLPPDWMSLEDTSIEESSKKRFFQAFYTL